ncbi:hypothetical protein [Pseudoxanthomonas sp. JBR18]|uniref:hypothetical protein n=1 Tax=Pseudoxanthomonas sp. JBR18 TaxID=2969308 RepID=UPI002304FAC2|nr:hypothetical protein [Pseudoxanthomonas sp. JBR18]WCE03476.1 hypothetical protein PJ250_15445 [Pseudoxanthomonas sp. JBR18]
MNKLRIASTSLIVLMGLSSHPAISGQAQVNSKVDNTKWASDGTRQDLLNNSENFFWGKKGKINTSSQIQSTSKNANISASDDVSQQFKKVFAGVPGAEYSVSNGQRIYSGCEPHNCAANKAFAVTDATGANILAAGFLAVRCGETKESDGTTTSANYCDNLPTLTIFYRDSKSKTSATSVGALKWANSVISADHHYTKFKIEEKYVN